MDRRPWRMKNLTEHRFFRYFPPEHTARLAKTAHLVTFAPRRVIFDEDDDIVASSTQ